MDKALLHFRILGPEVTDAISWQHSLIAEWLTVHGRDTGLSGPEADANFQTLRNRRILSVAGIVIGSLLILISVVAFGLAIAIVVRSRRLEVFRAQRASYIAREAETAQAGQLTATFSMK